LRLELRPAVPAKGVDSHLRPNPIHIAGYGVEVSLALFRPPGSRSKDPTSCGTVAHICHGVLSVDRRFLSIRPGSAVDLLLRWPIVRNCCSFVRRVHLGDRTSSHCAPIRPQSEASTCTRVVAMASREIAAAMQRVESVLKRRPEVGLHEDAPATARWEGGTRVVSRHLNGTRLPTDMPTELGGSGDHVTPGWLLRAGLGSCLATRIAMGAAAEGFEPTMLEVSVSSRSDARGLFGMQDDAGEPVCAGSRDMQVLVRIVAPGVAPERLRTLVEESHRCSPVSATLRGAVPMTLCIEVGDE
jgi:uncharacterized OsmC-like protein